MKYMLLFGSNGDFSALPAAEQARIGAAVGEWWGRRASR